MTKPKVQTGGIVRSVQADRDGKPIIKTLRRIYTDAVDPDLSVPDLQTLDDAAQDAIKQTVGEDIDGYDFRPLSETL